ncbi:MAG: hypothetical protein HN855_03610 [Anaerolineae bacterium]|nr:hypothetical protein [Anaerolineae bacterium]MBT7070328.1 hypothetical protein [Anaerolineae bacterium]MBT7324223.1 hypothetical protein [Anaerolineae bacterium]
MKKEKSILMIFLSILVIVQLACSLSKITNSTDDDVAIGAPPTQGANDSEETEAEMQTESVSVPPAYITIAGHIEDVPVYAKCDEYPDFRDKLLLFAETFSKTGAAFNLQIEYEFFMGASRCETDEMRATTDGLNVIDYLATHYGFEIDAHQEGGLEVGQDNYADIRFLGETVTPNISENVGGMIWNAPAQFKQLNQGEPGWIYPDFTWFPEILTLAVSRDHHQGDFSKDDIASGIWIPQGANQNFWVHNPNGRMVYVGPGEHDDWGRGSSYLSTPEFAQTLADQLDQGIIDRSKMYTVSLAVPQSVIFNADQHGKLLALLDQLTPLIESDQALYVTYSEAVNIWRTEYGAQPNIFYRDGVKPPHKK